MDLQGKSASPALKICGLTRAVDVEQCLSLGVTYAGFNFHAGSRRFIKPEAAAAVWRLAVRNHGAKALGTQPVAVFVDAPAETLRQTVAAFPELAVLQFHGDEDPAEVRSLAGAAPGRTVWKALGIASSSDLDRAESFAGAATLLLLDSAVIPSGSKVAGGSGHSFNWEWLLTHRPTLPLGLAGGISSSNVGAAMRYHPQLIDVCSGVEASPGIKDPAKVVALVREMRRA